MSCAVPMAHATSLATTLAASGMCTTRPQSTFRFAITTSGDTLTISADEAPPRLRQAPQAAIQPPDSPAARGFRAAALAAGETHAFADDRHSPDAATIERFYLALARLAETLHGSRRLHQALRQ